MQQQPITRCFWQQNSFFWQQKFFCWIILRVFWPVKKNSPRGECCLVCSLFGVDGGWYILLGYHLVEQKQPMHKTPSNQSDSPSNQKIRLYDYDEARSELLIRVGKKVHSPRKLYFLPYLHCGFLDRLNSVNQKKFCRIQLHLSITTNIWKI